MTKEKEIQCTPVLVCVVAYRQPHCSLCVCARVSCRFDVDAQPDDVTSEAAATRIDGISDATRIAEAGKMRFLVALLDNIRDSGHRALVFSQSRKVLDIIQRVLNNRGHRVARLDGTVRHLHEREDIIKRFSKNQAISVFLLTTQVGGVGLTLTAADRVVICESTTCHILRCVFEQVCN